MKMKIKKPRIKKGTLVASSNSLKKSICNRFVINVYFRENYKTVKYNFNTSKSTTYVQ
jgi:hypothetical protein